MHWKVTDQTISILVIFAIFDKKYHFVSITCQDKPVKNASGGAGGKANIDWCVFRSKNEQSGESVRYKSFVCAWRMSEKLGARGKPKSPFLEQLNLPPKSSPTSYLVQTKIADVFHLSWNYCEKCFCNFEHDVNKEKICLNSLAGILIQKVFHI